jgi:hypothetical protein
VFKLRKFHEALLDYRDSIPGRFREGISFSIRHRIQNGSGAHSASYPMGKVAGAEIDH